MSASVWAKIPRCPSSFPGAICASVYSHFVLCSCAQNTDKLQCLHGLDMPKCVEFLKEASLLEFLEAPTERRFDATRIPSMVRSSSHVLSVIFLPSSAAQSSILILFLDARVYLYQSRTRPIAPCLWTAPVSMTS